MSCQQLLDALLAFPADKLDKTMIQYVYNNITSNVSSTSSSSETKTKKTRKTKSNDDKADKPKGKQPEGLAIANAVRSAYYKVKKEEGMTYKDFNALWKSMSAEEKNAIKAKYAPKSTTSSTSSSAESSSVEHSEHEDDDHKESDNGSDNEDDITIDDIEESLNQLNSNDEKKSSPVLEEKKVASTKAKKTTKK